MTGRDKRGINRRELLKKLATGAGLGATLPGGARATEKKVGGAVSHAHAAHTTRPPETSKGVSWAHGSTEPPDPALTSPNWKPVFLDAHQNDTLLALADLLIPATNTPGATEAQVNRFIDLLLSGEPTETQEHFLQALSWLDGHCLSRHEAPFVALKSAQQTEVLTLLSHPHEDPLLAPGVEHFQHLKQWVVRAYYSSEIGHKELGYSGDQFFSEMPGCPNPDEHKL